MTPRNVSAEGERNINEGALESDENGGANMVCRRRISRVALESDTWEDEIGEVLESARHPAGGLAADGDWLAASRMLVRHCLSIRSLVYDRNSQACQDPSYRA
jgi:hypothetical protein